MIRSLLEFSSVWDYKSLWLWLLEKFPGDGRIWALSLLSGLCVCTYRNPDTVKLCGLDQPFRCRFLGEKNTPLAFCARHYAVQF